MICQPTSVQSGSGRPERWYGTYLNRWVLGLALGWTAAIAGLWCVELREHHNRELAEARIEADMGWERDMAYRRWVQASGGVYVPVSEMSPPNENLAHVPERDLVTPSGRKLTLVNSSYMFRQVAAAAGRRMAVSRTTSLKPLRADNAPDAGEAQALSSFERGAKEAVWFEDEGGQRVMRVMRPFYVEERCLKCHAQQGYILGDVRGGITTTVPVPTVRDELAALRPSMIGYAVLWLVGLAGIGAAGRGLRRRAVLQQEAERALRRSEEKYREMSQVDRLTGLANRASLLDRLQLAVQRAHRGGGRFAVLFMDFDRFKVVNDSLGHMAGDDLLVAVSQRLAGQVRRGVDTVAQVAPDALAARLGGDEFVLLLESLREAEEAMSVADRLLEALAVPYEIGQHRIVATASIGVVICDGSYAQAEDVLRDADTAMYEAKLRGRGRAVLFDESMRDRARRRMEIETDLRGALDAGQLELYYQPIVSLESGRVESYEALARWNHPRQGWISPAEFIPIAEESGLILRLGEWAFTEACRQMAQWRRELGPDAVPAVGVNLSRRQVVLPDLPEQLRRIAEAAGVEPGAIMLEITESAVMDDVTTASRVIRQIKDLGFQVALDDFGTGYSSLGSLHMFPIDVLKIDRSFVANLERGRDYAALVHTVTGLARNLGMRVVAEGVDSESKVTMLQALECEYAQGFLFARPMPASMVPSFRVPQIPAEAAAG